MPDISIRNEGDLVRLIQMAEHESLTLEFKACGSLQNKDKKKEEISKDVSAMANSAGGVIVYGLIEQGHVAAEVDHGFDPEEISKEWLEQVINSRIARRIDGVKIIPIPLSGDRAGRYAYVVEVPQSEAAPHQASDKRFYKRFNFQAVPMEEYEVRDVGNRSAGPNLSFTFRVDSAKFQKATEEGVTRACLGISISNSSAAPANYAIYSLYIDERISLVRGPSEWTRYGHNTIMVGGHDYPCIRWAKNHALPTSMPIFEGVEFSVVDGGLNFNVPNGTFYILTTIRAPKMLERMQMFSISCSEGHIVLSEMSVN